MTKTQYCTIRPMRKDEYHHLRRFLYDAIFLPEGVEPPPLSVTDIPELRVYIEDFGQRPHDVCFVAETTDGLIGAVWARIMNDYGHVDDQTPSLAISVKKEHRGKGIGSRLLSTILQRLHDEGINSVSLSVQKANPAVHLYCRFGFMTLHETEEEYVMLRELSSKTISSL